MKYLNITNGGSAIELMKAAGITGDAFSWDDLLHEGPVPAQLSLSELSKVRGDYIIGQGLAQEAMVRHKFEQRDALLTKYGDYDRVTLWFEHDLYDQLQLIQILDWFYHQEPIETELQLICVDKHLGHHTPVEFAALETQRRKVTPAMLLLASEAWRAFTADSPMALNQIVSGAFDELPLLKPALKRLLMEYPDLKTGLPLTERLILQCLQSSVMTPGELFKAYTRVETDEFLGDSPFWIRLNQMAFCQFPLIAYEIDEAVGYPLNRKQKVSLTPYSSQVLSGKKHWFDESSLTKWLGGNQISPLNRWCFNPATRRVERQ